ncbi:MAG: hypothetical protein H0T47_19445 [Planctomycetaceae bacterium]|nr:hypothetical protein [Planctomycetaceae bacterium]
MAKSLTGEEFAKALSEGSLKGPLVRIGMAKQADDDSDTILFAEGAVCSEWISIPVSIIEEVKHLTMISCRDHEHPLVQIHFKEPPAENKVARAFADLARHAKPSTPLGTHVPDKTTHLAQQVPTFPSGGKGKLDTFPPAPRGCICAVQKGLPTCVVIPIIIPGTNIEVPSLYCFYECEKYQCSGHGGGASPD